MATATKLKLHTMLGNYPNTKAIKSGAIQSDLVDFDFAEVKVANSLFKRSYATPNTTSPNSPSSPICRPRPTANPMCWCPP